VLDVAQLTGEQVPAEIWRVYEWYSGDLEDDAAPREPVDVDSTGELQHLTDLS